jgi:hypothetical protein
LGVAALKPEASITLFNQEVIIEIYYQNLKLNNSLSTMMVVWFEVEIKGPKFSDCGPCE